MTRESKEKMDVELAYDIDDLASFTIYKDQVAEKQTYN